MRSLQESLEAFEARGVRIAAVSVDPTEVNRDHAGRMGFTFPLLSDSRREATRAYDLLHEKAVADQDIARPAEFIVDGAGVVRWTNLTEDYRVRLTAEQALEALDALGRVPRRPAPSR